MKRSKIYHFFIELVLVEFENIEDISIEIAAISN